MIVVALHGFFGTPDDWFGPLANLDPEGEHEILVPDLGVWATRAEITDFDTFSASFNRSVRSLMEKRGEPVMIVGYSLGARLAAHCVLDEPDLYRAALLVSMNPGLPQADLEARRQRVEGDTQWAERMRREPWESTWMSWNEQSALRPGTRSLRKSGDHKHHLEERGRIVEGRREAWARAMEIWSLGHQADLRADLLEWAADDGHRLTVMTGTDDSKFTELTTKWVAQGIAMAGLPAETIRHRLVLGAGHRLLLESPEDVVSEVSTLLG
jgi:2-succinyl-6-hydroxy-2,4-cyclohexadiene-1-carboxylate synthase